VAGEEDPKVNGGPMAALAALPKLLSAPLDDIRRIAEGMQYLPELATILTQIEARVERLDDEVMKMRKAVESMEGNVNELPEQLDRIPFTRKRKP
jgi:hypothetical protein